MKSTRPTVRATPAAMAVPCPRCRALTDQPCFMVRGWGMEQRGIHRERAALARDPEELRLYCAHGVRRGDGAYCRTCDAAAIARLTGGRS